MNWYAILAIYRYEMSRTRRTLLQSIVAPVISTALYFVVFGAAIGHRINEIGGVPYGAFIVPGLTMLSVRISGWLRSGAVLVSGSALMDGLTIVYLRAMLYTWLDFSRLRILLRMRMAKMFSTATSANSASVVVNTSGLVLSTSGLWKPTSKM